MNETSLDTLTLATFTPLVNTRFRVRLAPDQTLELGLLEAVAGRSAAAPAGALYESFSLIFTGPADHPLPQQMFHFEHDQIGQFPLFITPVKQDQRGLHYQAVFNRMVKNA